MSAGTGAIVAGLIRRAERRIVEQLREAGARSSAKAQPLSGLRLIEERRLQRMLGADAIRETTQGTYYLDEAALDAYMQRRRKRVLFVVGAALLAALGLAGLNRK